MNRQRSGSDSSIQKKKKCRIPILESCIPGWIVMGGSDPN